MSDTITRELLRIALPAYGSSFATNVYPDRSLPGVAGYIPFTGLGERLAGFGGSVIDAGTAGVNYLTGNNFQSPTPDFMHDWGQRAQATEDQLYGSMGGVEPQDEAERVLKGITAGAGATGPLMSGAIRAAAPALIRPLLSMLPSFEHAARNAKITGGLGGASTAAMDAINAAEGADKSQTDTPTMVVRPEFKQLFQPAGQAQAREAPPNVRPEFQQLFAPPGQQTPAPVAQGSEPPFSEQGQSPYTFMRALVTLGGAIVGAHVGRSIAQIGDRVGAMERDARVADPAYAKATTDYENAKIAAQGNQISGEQPQPPQPSANIVKDTLVKAQNWGLDGVAKIQQLIRLTGDNPSATQRLVHQVGEAFNEQMWDMELGQFVRTGHDPVSGVTIPSPGRYSTDVANLDPPRQQIFNDAVNARDEKNNRDRMIKDAIANGDIPDPQVLRHNFYNQDRSVLDQREALAMSDPVINDLIVRHDLIGQGMLDIMRQRGYITDQVWRDVKAAHPHFLPEGDVEGRVRQNFGYRQLSPNGGIAQVNTNATSLMAQHIEGIMRDIKMNDMRRAVDDHMQQFQDNTPGAAKSVYDAVQANPLIPGTYGNPAVGSPAVGSREQVIPIRRSTGVTYRKYDDSWLYDTLVGTNTTRARANFDSAGKVRQLLQAGTTGVASLITGRAVPFRNLVYTAVQAPINAPKGYYGGPISALTGARLPKFVTAPLDIPLNVVGAGGTWLANVGSRAALTLSDMFRPDNMNRNPVVQVMDAIYGKAGMRMLSDKMMDLYQNSVYYEGAIHGLGGQSLQQRQRLPLFNRDESNRSIRLATAQVEPRILINADGNTRMTPFVINARNMITDAFIHASESTHDFLYRLNRGNPNFDPQGAIATTRRIVGDPSESGLGAIPQTARVYVPYANVAVQGTRAVGRAFSEQPLNTSLAMVTGYGALAAASMLTAFQSQQNLQHYTNDMSTQQRAANLVFYNGKDGEHSLMMIPMPQEARWIWPIIQEGMFHVLNMVGAAHDGATRKDVLTILKDLAHEHIDKATIQASLHGANDAFNFLDFPPLVKLGAALGGGHLRIDAERLISDAQTGDLGLNSIGGNTAAVKAMPNESPDDMAARNANGRKWTEVLSSLFGGAAGTFDTLFNLQRYHQQGNSWMDSLGNTAHDWMQGLKDFNPQGNTLLWENAVSLTKQPPITEMEQRAVAEMRKTQGGMSSAEAKQGLTGGKFPLPVPQYPTTQGKVPQDPTMRAMYEFTAAQLAYLDKTVLPEIGQINQQMQAVDAAAMDPQERRKWMNERKRDLADKWRFVHSIVNDTNDVLSQYAGKTVDLRRGINWQGGLDQF